MTVQSVRVDDMQVRGSVRGYIIYMPIDPGPPHHIIYLSGHDRAYFVAIELRIEIYMHNVLLRVEV